MTNTQFRELTLEKLETFLLRFSDERRTGQLQVQGEGAKGGRIDLREGRVVGVQSPFVSESLAEIARKLGFLTKPDMQKAVDALSSSESAGKQLSDILLDEKLLTKEGLEACLRYQAESAMHSMIGFHGRISFIPGNVSRSEVEINPREILKRMKEKDDVEGMSTAVLAITAPGTWDESEPGAVPLAPGAMPEFEAQSEMRRIAQAAIREAALAAEAMQADLDAQAAAIAQQMLEDAHRAEEEAHQLAREQQAHEHGELAEVGEEELVAEVGAAELELVLHDEKLAPAAPETPRLAGVILAICRPGATATEALLEFALHFSSRVMLFAATPKGLRLAYYKVKPPATLDAAKLEGLLLPVNPDGNIGKVLEERIPTRGPFMAAGESDLMLAAALDPAVEGDTILFPIALGERPIGLIFGDGVPPGDPGLLEDLAAAVAATAVVMENKLVARGKK